MTDHDVTEQLRGTVFDLLAALSYLRSIDVLPKDFEIDRIEQHARQMLDIKEYAVDGSKVEVMGRMPLINFPEKPVPPAVQQVMLADIPSHRICPMCGDRGPKTVHLKRRPRGGLQCQMCRFEYAFPTKWV